MGSDLKDKLLREIQELPDILLEKIQQVIDAFKRDGNTSGSNGRFDDVFSSVSEEDADDMLGAVNDCRKIEENAW